MMRTTIGLPRLEDSVKSDKPPRERAARALCRLNGLSEDTDFEGRPMWESFLSQVDVVLEAALSKKELERMKTEQAR